MVSMAQGLIEAVLHALELSPASAFELAQQAYLQADGLEAAQAQLLMGKALHRQEQPLEAIPLLEAAAQGLSLFDQSLELDVQTLLIRLHRERGNLQDAGKALERATYLARQIERPELEADLLNQQAALLYERADHAGALRCLNLALLTSRNLGNPFLEGKFLNNIGILLTHLGDYPKAMEHLLGAYQILSDQYANHPLAAVNLGNIGNLYQEMQELPTALEYYNRALELAVQIKDSRLQIAAHNNLAQIFHQLHQLPAAKAQILLALQLAQEKAWEPLVVESLEVLGKIHLALGDTQAALEVHSEALERAQLLGVRGSEIAALICLAEDYLAAQQPEQSEPLAQQALQQSQQSQQKKSEYQAHRLLAEAAEQQNQWQQAALHLKEYHRLEREVFSEENERKRRMLSSVLELERARDEAEIYRLRRDTEQQAREKAEAEVAERTEELEQARLEVVSRLALAAEYRDDETGDHTWRVGRNAAFIARQLGWSAEDVEQMRLAARLHDVGKIGISDLILLKPAKLTQEEYATMRSHTTIGARILSGGHTKLLRLAEEIALTHHERWDGKGYPRGLAGQEIPLCGRIVAVADVLDALTHQRPYKKAWPLEKALEEIRRASGSQFDPNVVEAAMQVFVSSGELEQLDANLFSNQQAEWRQLGIANSGEN